MSNERRASDEAYQEYLSLRENRSSRGNYVKDDTLYGSYFSSANREGESQSYRNGSSIDNTPYGSSEMRRKQQELERERYLAERARETERAGEKGRKPVATQGRRNKADEDKPEKNGKKSKANGKKNKKKKSGNGLRIALLVVLILVIGIGGTIAAGLVVVKDTLDNVGRVELDPDLIGINPQVDSELRDYRNIALLGIDARPGEADTDARSDAIIVVSIHKETGEIKMFSVYRDTMLYVGDGYGLDKINHAYFYGGPTQVLYTLNKNLDLNIKEVVIVNWKSVADTVDALGGIDIEILESEIDELNYITTDTYNNIGGSDKLIETPGVHTLTGNQAVAYARIRKDAATGDYRRNERMKIVVKATFEKAVQLNPKAIKKISNDILPQIKTNMSTADMMGMAMDLTAYTMTDSVGFPIEMSDWTGEAFYCVPVTLETNVSQLHAQFFGQEGYIPTQDVRENSGMISNQTGYY